MPKSAIAKDVDHHVFLEFLAEFRSHFCRMHNGFWIVTIHVEYRSFYH